MWCSSSSLIVHSRVGDSWRSGASRRSPRSSLPAVDASAESHSGFLEVLLGAGIVGLLLLLAIMGLAAWRSGVVAWRRPEPLVVWSFALVVYVIAVNAGETYVGANLLPWILLCIVLGQSVRSARQVQSGNRAPS